MHVIQEIISISRQLVFNNFELKFLTYIKMSVLMGLCNSFVAGTGIIFCLASYIYIYIYIGLLIIAQMDRFNYMDYESVDKCAEGDYIYKYI